MSPNARINRWRLRLSEYTYEIRHKPGKDHKVADALSRLPTEGLDSTPLDEDIPVLAVETRASDALEAASPAEAPLGALTAQEIILGQAEDAFCKERLKELIADDAQIYQFYEGSMGIEIYSKDDFVRLLTIPTSSLKRIKILDKSLKDGKIVKLNLSYNEEIYLHIDFSAVDVLCKRN